MFESLVVILLVVIVIQLSAVLRAQSGTTRLLSDLATNPIRHDVNIVTDGIAGSIKEMEGHLYDIHLDVSRFAQNFLSDDDSEPHL